MVEANVGTDADKSDDAQEALAPPVIDALVENHRQFLGFLQRRVGDRALAEDILQDAFARGLDHVPTLRSEESAVAWFYRVLRNAVTDHYRRRGASERALERLARELDQDTAVTEDLHTQVCQCVSRLAATLKPEYAQALKRVELEGVPVKDFAAESGISATNAGVRVFRARDALRKRVVASCGSCAEHGCMDCSCQSEAGAGPAAL